MMQLFKIKLCLLLHENKISALTFSSRISIPMFFLARFDKRTFQKKTLFASTWEYHFFFDFCQAIFDTNFLFGKILWRNFSKVNFDWLSLNISFLLLLLSVHGKVVFFYMKISFLLWLSEKYFQKTFCKDLFLSASIFASMFYTPMFRSARFYKGNVQKQALSSTLKCHFCFDRSEKYLIKLFQQYFVKSSFVLKLKLGSYSKLFT